MMSKCAYYLSCACLPLFIVSCSCTKEQQTAPSQESVKTQVGIALLSSSADLKKFEYAIVKFYLPTCPACKMSIPAYQELSKLYSTVAFLEADVEANETLATEFSIRSVPTFIVFKKGEKDGRVDGFNKAKLEELLRALTNKETTNTTYVKENASTEEFHKTIATGKVIVKFYRNSCGFCQLIAHEYERVAGEYNNSIKFIAVDTEKLTEVSQEYSIDGVPTFIAFKDGKQVDHFSGAVKSELERMAKELSATTQVPNVGSEAEEQPASAANDTED